MEEKLNSHFDVIDVVIVTEMIAWDIISYAN